MVQVLVAGCFGALFGGAATASGGLGEGFDWCGGCLVRLVGVSTAGSVLVCVASQTPAEVWD